MLVFLCAVWTAVAAACPTHLRPIIRSSSTAAVVVYFCLFSFFSDGEQEHLQQLWFMCPAL